MRKVFLLAVLFFSIIQSVTLGQLKYYSATGGDSLTFAATNEGIYIFKRDSELNLNYIKKIIFSFPEANYIASASNDSSIIFSTRNSLFYFSFDESIYPVFKGQLDLGGIVSIRNFGKYYAVLRNGQEQYVIGLKNDSLEILSQIDLNCVSYTGYSCFTPSVTYPYLLACNLSSHSNYIQRFQFSESDFSISFLDSILVTPASFSLQHIIGGNDYLFLLERTGSYNYYLTKIEPKDFTVLLSKYEFNSPIPLVDESDCTDEIIRLNSSYYDSSLIKLTIPSIFQSRNFIICKNKIYHTEDATLYYSTKQVGTTISYGTISGYPTAVNETKTNNNYRLFENYPNPFNPTTTITYYISEETPVRIDLFSHMGELIKVLVNEIKSPGQHQLLFDGSYLASGVYYYRIIAGNFRATKKLILLK